MRGDTGMKRLSLILLLFLGGCGQSDQHRWLGYAEGDYVFVSAPVAGWVDHMTVNRGDWVQNGTRLFTLDDTHETAERDEAVANINQAEAELAQEQANLAYTGKELTRQTGLAHDKAGIPSTYDQTLESHQASQGRIVQLEGQIRQMQAAFVDARYQLSQRDIVSLTHGRVQDILFFQGEYAPAMTPIVSILPPENIYVRFFVPEQDFAKIHIGQRVAISCDSCKANMTAVVSFIASQEEFTPPIIFSLDSRQQLVFKVEARVKGGLALNPGQPVDIRPL
jgi:HlyD family secretion protein